MSRVKTSLTPADYARIRAEALSMLDRGESCSSVSVALGLPRSTIHLWAQRKAPRPRRDVTDHGYSNWSPAVKSRWDRFWSSPDSHERLFALLDDDGGEVGTP